MDDLISRQAAIDAAIEATDSWEGVCSIGRQKCIENYINSLPFAPGMDLISRRAAIDICANVIDLFRGWFGAGVLVAIKESIEELPPAQLATDKNVGTKLGTNLAEVGTDCISRQAAIDALAEDMPQTYTPDGSHPADEGIFMAQEIYADCIQTLKELPSAQPEIIRCKDCKYAEYIDDVQTLWCTECGQGRTVAPDDFCSYAERREGTI